MHNRFSPDKQTGDGTKAAEALPNGSCRQLQALKRRKLEHQKRHCCNSLAAFFRDYGADTKGCLDVGQRHWSLPWNHMPHLSQTCIPSTEHFFSERHSRISHNLISRHPFLINPCTQYHIRSRLYNICIDRHQLLYMRKMSRIM